MFKKPSKKQFIIRRILLSSIATLSVIIIATSAILFMLGYRLDGGHGLEQGALMQFDSKPNGADVYVDNELIGGRTATKKTVVAGTHSVRIAREGYQDWNRTLSLEAGTLTWLDYILLVPNERPVETVTTYKNLAGLTISPDGKWALAHEVAANASFSLVDLRSETVKSSTLTLPTALYSEAGTKGVKHSFSVASWDSGSRYVLVKHVYKDKTEWLVVDTQEVAKSTNASRTLSVDFKDVQFLGTSGNTLYALTTEGAIRKVDLSAETISRAFVSHVESFTLSETAVISYVGVDPDDATKRVAGAFRDGDEAAHVLRSVTSEDVVLKIATGRYVNDDYVAIAEGNIVTILKGRYPSSGAQDTSSLAQFATLQLDGAVSSISFSPRADFIVAQSGATFKSYEIEHTRTETGTIAVPNGKAASTLKWLDKAHLWSDDGNTLTMRDFNGLNSYAIMSVVPGFDASLSQSGRYFYAVGTTDAGYHLQRIKMILN